MHNKQAKNTKTNNQQDACQCDSSDDDDFKKIPNDTSSTKRRKMTSNDQRKENERMLGSPTLGTALPLTGASFKWASSEDIETFATYTLYLQSVTKGGDAAGPEKAKYGRRNKSKIKNENDEWTWVSFECKSCPDCSKEVRLSCKQQLLYMHTFIYWALPCLQPSVFMIVF
jgi:hypothetical protein